LKFNHTITFRKTALTHFKGEDRELGNFRDNEMQYITGATLHTESHTDSENHSQSKLIINYMWKKYELFCIVCRVWAQRANNLEV